MAETEATKQISPELEREAAQKARDRARTARWDLDVAVFLFAVLIIVVILLFQDVRVEIVAPVALFGLAMVWLIGWRRGKQLYQRFYGEEIIRIERELKKTVQTPAEDTIEERIQKALRERYK